MYKGTLAVLTVVALWWTVAWGQGATSTARPILAGPLARLDIKDARVEAVRKPPRGTLNIALHFGIDPGWLDPLGWWRYLRAFLRGARQGRLHDPLQAPGVAILDAGAVARWVWRGRTLGDYPPLEAALERVRSLPGRR